jgi:hypothetical protein
MENEEHLQALPPDKRAASLNDLFRLSKLKLLLESWTHSDIREAQAFRDRRHVVERAAASLRKQMAAVRAIAERYPFWDNVELLFGGEEVREAIIRIGGEIAAGIELMDRKQRELASLINPQLRTKAEKQLVQIEFVQHSDLPRREKSPAIDQWFITTLARAGTRSAGVIL